MKLKEIYSKKELCRKGFFDWQKPVISFEVFPPKNESISGLCKEINLLKKYEPVFVSLTCNAGGSAAGFSCDNLSEIREKTGIDVMPHLTCICARKNTIEKALNEINGLGIENILALRGDEPQDIQICYTDFKYANELVSFIKEKTELSIGVAGYPEGHIDCRDIFSDIENLKRKVDAGADAIFTQLFFDNTKFFSYVQLVRDAGIKIPVIAGIMPIISAKQVEKMTSMARVTIPQALQDRIEKFKDSPSDMKKLGIDLASNQCRQLIDAGVAGLHFYTLNKAYSTFQILENIL